MAACVLAIYAAMLHRYAVDFPMADDFGQILALPQQVGSAQTLPAKLKEVFSLNPEHRIATLRLAALLQAHVLGGLDFRMLMYLGSALVIVAGALLLSTFDRTIRPFAAALAAALLLSPASYEATFWPSAGLLHFGAAAYEFAALYCLSRRGFGWQLGAAGAALAAALTSAGGLMVFPSAVLLSSLQRRWRTASGWALCGLALFAVYFIGYEAPPWQGSLGSYLREPLLVPRFFFTALGALGRNAFAAPLVGMAVVLVWIGLGIAGRIRSVPPLVIAWIACLLLSFAAITWGRAGFGIPGALLSRYRVYSEFAVLVTLAALLTQVSRDAARRTLAIALPLGLALFFVSWRYDLVAMERFAIDRRIELDYYAAEGHNLPTPIPPAGYRDSLLAAAHQGGIYTPTGSKPPRHLRADNNTLDASHAPAVVIEPPIAGNRVALIRVYAPGYEDGAIAWLKSDDHLYRGTLDRMAQAPLALGFRTGFLWGLYALDGVAAGRYRIGVGAGDRDSISILWSDQWITVE